MPYLPHLKLQISGRLGDTFAGALETWSIGLRWMVNSGAFPALDQDAMDQCAIGPLTPTQAFIGSSLFSSNVFLESVKSYRIGGDGKAVGPIGAVFLDGATHGSAGIFQPYQVADVVSLVADGRGKGKFGRIYLPGLANQVGRDGLRPTALLDAALPSIKTWLTDMDASLGGATKVGQDVSLCVAGRTGLGTLRPVATIRLGQVPDTQRRRRRSLPEGYVSVAYG